jgi:hypothetical protein
MIFIMAGISACTDSKSDAGNSKQSYEFESSVSTIVVGNRLSDRTSVRLTKEADAFYDAMECDSQPNYICFAPTKLTGRYFASGLLIQANGSGMQSYFHVESWSELSAESELFDFDSENPTAESGNLNCCGGEGDLTGENVYFSDAIYAFGYLDSSFYLPYSASDLSKVSPFMKGEHTFRFVLFDDVVEVISEATYCTRIAMGSSSGVTRTES